MYHNPDCDGSGPCSEIYREVKLLPTGGDSNAILCKNCFDREIKFRIERNKDLATDCQFQLPKWGNLETYRAEMNPVGAKEYYESLDQ